MRAVVLHGTKMLSVTKTLSEHIDVPYPCSISRLNNSLLNDRSRSQSIPENTWISNIIEVKDVVQITKISNEKISKGLSHTLKADLLNFSTPVKSDYY